MSSLLPGAVYQPSNITPSSKYYIPMHEIQTRFGQRLISFPRGVYGIIVESKANDLRYPGNILSEVVKIAARAIDLKVPLPPQYNTGSLTADQQAIVKEIQQLRQRGIILSYDTAKGG